MGRRGSRRAIDLARRRAAGSRLEAGDLPSGAHDRRELGRGCIKHLDRGTIVHARVDTKQPRARRLAVVGVDQYAHHLVALAQPPRSRVVRLGAIPGARSGRSAWRRFGHLPDDLAAADSPAALRWWMSDSVDFRSRLRAGSWPRAMAAIAPARAWDRSVAHRSTYTPKSQVPSPVPQPLTTTLAGLVNKGQDGR